MTVGKLGNQAAEAAAKAAAEAARKAAIEAARKAAAEAAAKAAAEAAAAARAAQAEKAKVAGKDQQNASGKELMAKHTGPLDAQAIGQMKGDGAAIADEFEGFGKAAGSAVGEALAAEPPSLDDAQSDPAAIARLRALKASDDPAAREALQSQVKDLVKEALHRNVGGPGDEKDPEAVFDGFKDDLKDLAKATGLGPEIEAASGAAVKETAKDLLDQGVNSSEVAKNPALGKILASLQNDSDPAVKEKLHDTVRGWTTAALNRNLEGKQGEDDVKDALRNGYKDDVAKLAEDTGLGALIQETSRESLEGAKDRIEDAAKDGGGGGILGGLKDLAGKVTGFIGDVVGEIADTVGDVIHAATDVASGAIDTVSDLAGDAVRGISDVAGDVADAALDTAGKGFDLAARGASEIAGGALDAVGADGAADVVRATGDVVGGLGERALDRAGDVANTVIDAQGTIAGGAIEAVGGITSNVVGAAGEIADTALDVAGLLASEGPMGAAEALADQAIGPEQFPDQIDGFTGIVTNRLGKGDAVFLKAEVGADVGIGPKAGASANGQGAEAGAEAYAGAKVTGGATLSRNKDGNIELALEIGGGVEAGVRANAEVTAGGQDASVKGKAALTGEGKGKITLEFDPNKPEDVARLKALTEPTPAKVIAAAANPLAAVAITGPALQDAIAHNEKSREIGVSAGAKAEASAKADLGGLTAQAGLKADAVAGMTNRQNKDGTTETTYFLRAGASASAGANGVEATAGGNALTAVTVKKDASGRVIGLSGEEDVSANAGVKKGTDAAGGSTQVITHKRELEGEALAEAQARIAGGEPALDVFNELKQREDGVKDSTLTTDSDSFSVGFDGKLSLGVSVGISAKATVGRSHTEVMEGEPQDVTDPARELAHKLL